MKNLRSVSNLPTTGKLPTGVNLSPELKSLMNQMNNNNSPKNRGEQKIQVQTEPDLILEDHLNQKDQDLQIGYTPSSSRNSDLRRSTVDQNIKSENGTRRARYINKQQEAVPDQNSDYLSLKLGSQSVDNKQAIKFGSGQTQLGLGRGQKLKQIVEINQDESTPARPSKISNANFSNAIEGSPKNVSQLQKDLQKMKEERDQAIEELQKIKNEKNTGGLKLNQNVDDEKFLLKKDLQEKEKEIKALKAVVEKYRNEKSNLRENMSEMVEKQKANIAEVFQKQFESVVGSKEMNLKNIQEYSQNIEKKLQDANKEIESLKDKNKESTSLLKDLKNKLATAENNFNNQKQEIEKKNKQIQEKTQQYEQLKSKESKIKGLFENLQQAEVDIAKSLKCHNCNKVVIEPVTVIPCGHTFCKGCKQAYDKNCIKCPEIKKEAMYRNLLLDDIMDIVKIIRNLKSSLNEF